MTEKPRIAFHLDRSAVRVVAERAQKLMPTSRPRDIGDVGASIQYLRGVGSRATFALSSFYLVVASDENGTNRCTVSGYPGRLFQAQTHFSSLGTIALACRKAFDHGKGLTGATFGRASDRTLEMHAEYWAKNSAYPKDDAYRALHFLRSLIGKCSKKPDALFKEGTTLGRRIGFLKQYADRSAAHLSLEDHEFDQLDLAHVVAAMSLIGAIICRFDNGTPSNYFNDIDEGAFEAALALFPDIPRFRLFERMNVDMQGNLCWEWGEENGMQMFLEQLPYAISWY